VFRMTSTAFRLGSSKISRATQCGSTSPTTTRDRSSGAEDARRRGLTARILRLGRDAGDLDGASCAASFAAPRTPAPAGGLLWTTKERVAPCPAGALAAADHPAGSAEVELEVEHHEQRSRGREGPGSARPASGGAPGAVPLRSPGATR